MSETCAHHEAGHAVAAHCAGARVQLLTIDPEWDDDYLRHDGLIEVQWPAGVSKKRLRDSSIAVALAGPVAEMIHTQEPYHPALVQAWSVDWQVAWELSSEEYPDEVRRLRFLEKETRRLHEWMSQDHIWQAVACLVDELLTHEHMEAEETHSILKNWL
ncbi:MAG: hypothetical protein ACE361_11955 [Aureliella sp.]